MEEFNKYYEMLECNPEDSDYVFNEKCNHVFEKYNSDAEMYDKLQNAYFILLESRKECVKPKDDKGEERNLRNIEHELLACQQKLASGLKKKDCIKEINEIKISIVKISPFWVHNTKKNLESTGFANYCEEQYEEYIRTFFEEQMEKRILGLREDKVFGWLKNYSVEKGDFVHYARNSMAHIRSDLKQRLCQISTGELDSLKMEKSAGCCTNFSDEEVKKTKAAEKKRQEIREKYNIQKLLQILAKAPHILKICEAVNASSQANEFARYYISNVTITFLKEVILEILPEGATTGSIDSVIMRSVSDGTASANMDDIYESLSQQFVDYIMTRECVDIDDIIAGDLCKYQDIGVDKKGDIRFFKGGIKYIDEILVQYYARVKGEMDKRSQSMKTIRTRHWKKFEDLVLAKEQIY